nr:hypothetical protein [uncultured Shimia sp.]
MTHKLILAIAATVLVAGSATAGTEVTPQERLERLGTDGAYQIAQNCGSGNSYCSAGSLGPGGCYSGVYAFCADGMICNRGWSICTVDTAGGRVPYCYEPSKPNTCAR